MREYDINQYAKYYFTDEQIYEMCKKEIINFIISSLEKNISIKNIVHYIVNIYYLSTTFSFKIVNAVIYEHPEYNYLIAADELNLL